jgi:ribose/galactose isomerase
MRIAIGSDHAGFPLKEAVKSFLTEEHRDIVDLGTHSTDPVDYSDYAEAIGRALRENRAERGILLLREWRWRLDGREPDSWNSRGPVSRHLFGAPGR